MKWFWIGCTLAIAFTTHVRAADDANLLPQSYSKQNVYYTIIQKTVFDLDEVLQNIGITVYACRLQNAGLTKDFKGVGACLFESIKYNFKEDRASTVYAWVLNEQGQYLSPLKIEWKNTHKSWFGLAQEFLFLAFENHMGWSVKAENNISSTRSSCQGDMISSKDLGNFIGDLIITIPKGRTLHDYLRFNVLKQVDTDKLTLRSQTPSYIDKKRTYQLFSKYQNRNAEIVELRLFTNYNMIRRRDFCVSGHAQIERYLESKTGYHP